MTSPTHSDLADSLRKASIEHGTAARQLAYEALRRVEEDDAYANLILPNLLDRGRLPGRDAALATELTYGTLRSQGLYDSIIQYCSRRSIDQVDAGLRPVLRMGAHQLLSMRVPAHAAVDQSVKLGRAAKGHGAAKFVNAVLRGVSERGVDDWMKTLLPGGTERDTEYLSVRYSHPEWVIRALRESLAGAGRELNETVPLLVANNTAARVTLAMLPGLSSADSSAAPGQWSPTAASVPQGDPRGLQLVQHGVARVQDEGSQLAALMLAYAPLEGKDTAWADLCAGPGGKAALLAATGAQRGARLTAFEVQRHRAELVDEALKGLRDSTETIVADGRDVAESHPEQFDRVLVDVPCTGLGALRRRPESRWRRQPADLATLTPLQRELLTAAVDATRPGGIIAYVTCSPHPAETRLVVNDVLRHREDLVAIDAVDVLLDVAQADMPHTVGPTVGKGGKKRRSVQLWPHQHDTDAMFVCLLRKSEK